MDRTTRIEDQIKVRRREIYSGKNTTEEFKMRKLICCITIAVVGLQAGKSAQAQWYSIPQLQSIPVTSFLVTSDSTLFVAGYYHSLYRSTDNGDTWVNVIGQIPADTILSLGAADGDIFAGTTGAGIFRSADNGGTWVKSDSGLLWGSAGDINQFANVDSGLYVATTSGVYFTSDSGNSWRLTIDGLRTLLVVTPETTYTYTTNVLGITSTPAGLIITQDGENGAHLMVPGTSTWKYVGLGTHWCDAGALTAIDTTVFAGTTDGVLMYTGQDTTWIQRSNGLPEFINDCLFAVSDTVLFLRVGLVNGAIYASYDHGGRWSLIDDSALAGSSVGTIAADRDYLFVGTEAGAWRIPIRDLATAVNDGHSRLPEKYSLSQNYPNPFNPTTNIGYRIPKFAFVTMNVYNVLGQEVASLVNGVKRPGNYVVQFNGSGLASGVYFCKLSTSPVSGKATDIAKVRKMILLK